jgi:hypothetical protein
MEEDTVVGEEDMAVEVMITTAPRCEAAEAMAHLEEVVTDPEADGEDLVHQVEAPLAQVE